MQPRRVIFFLWILLCSCSGKQQEHEVSFDFRMEEQKLTLPLDGKTSYVSLALTYLQDPENDKDYLVYLANAVPAIHVFDLDSCKLHFSIPMHVDGPDGVGRPSGMKVFSMDSILIVSGYDRKISWINREGTVLHACNLFKSGQIAGPDTGMPQSYTDCPAYVREGKVFFNVAPDRKLWDPSYFDAPTKMELDPHTCAFRYFGGYPEPMRGAVWSSSGVSHSTTVNSKGEWVSSFSADHHIQVLRPGDEDFKSHFAKSRFFDIIEPMENPSLDNDWDYAFTTPRYAAIIHDPHRKVYYRMAMLGLNERLENSNYYDQEFSILVLDEDFNLLGEKKFPGKRYKPNQFFLTEKGLFLSDNNDNNPDLREDELSFTLLEWIGHK